MSETTYSVKETDLRHLLNHVMNIQTPHVYYTEDELEMAKQVISNNRESANDAKEILYNIFHIENIEELTPHP